jgi:integrase
VLPDLDGRRVLQTVRWYADGQCAIATHARVWHEPDASCHATDACILPGFAPAELAQLKVEGIDSKRIMIRVRQGKGRHDRDVPLSDKLLAVLREYSPRRIDFCFRTPGAVQSEVAVRRPRQWLRSRW